MSSHDPTVTKVALPPSLAPTPPKPPAPPAPAVAEAIARPTLTSTPSVLGAVKEICESAQRLAFPSVSTPVNIAVTDRAGADYQNNSAMGLFGMMKAAGSLPDGIKSPRDVAAKLAEHMQANDKQGIIAKLDVAGAGFINVFLSKQWIASRVHSIVTDGVLPPPGPALNVVVDFSSPNVAKEMHVGHLRSTIIGDTICRLLEFSGHRVQRVNHVGDWGTQFGMLIGHLKNVFPNYASEPPPIADLQQFYRDAKKVFDDDEAFKKVAHDEVVKLQGGDGSSRYAWGQICDVSRCEFEKIYSRLEVKLEEVGESFYNEYIPGVVRHLQEIGLAKNADEPDSAGRYAKIIFPPGSKHENPLIVTKSDGGFGYDSTDMAAIWYRLFELKADWVVYVTDAGQGPHFDLIFEAATAAGWVTGQRLDHCPFGMVCDEHGKKYKTRSGEVVRLVDLLDEAVQRMLEGMEARRAEAETEGTRGRAAVMTPEEMAHASRVLGYGAVKYADLKGNRNSNYNFSYERMLDPKGNTAVYLLYAGARISSILRNAPVSPAELVARGTTIQLDAEEELQLARAILRFQEVIEETTVTLLPNTLCEYAYSLCIQFTKFYQNCKVIGSPEQDSRILQLSALEGILRKSYELLGLGYLERI